MLQQVNAAVVRWSGHYCYCFGTKRPWVQIPPPRQSEMPSQRLVLLGFVISFGAEIGWYSCEVQLQRLAIEAGAQSLECFSGGS